MAAQKMAILHSQEWPPTLAPTHEIMDWIQGWHTGANDSLSQFQNLHS